MKNELFPDAPRPLIFGHRGFPARAPENTMEGFRLCVQRGVPGVELDIHRCASGELVVFHDANTRRVTGIDGIIEETSWTRLQTLTVSSSQADTGIRTGTIPLLSTIFDELGDRLYYDIEIKDENNPPNTAVVDQLLEMVRRYGLEQRILISSFNPLIIRHAVRTASEIPSAVIYADEPELPYYLRHGEGRLISGCRVLKPCYTGLNRLKMAWHSRLFQRPVLPWTVDDREAGLQLLDWGVSGLITNNPGLYIA